MTVLGPAYSKPGKMASGACVRESKSRVAHSNKERSVWQESVLRKVCSLIAGVVVSSEKVEDIRMVRLFSVN